MFFRQQIPRISHLDAMVVAYANGKRLRRLSFGWALFQFFGLTVLVYVYNNVYRLSGWQFNDKSARADVRMEIKNATKEN